jgi:uncharacterized protein (DUF3084 family)
MTSSLEPPAGKTWITVLAEVDRLTAQRDDLLAQLLDAETELRTFRNQLAAARAERDNARSQVVSLR